MIPAPCGTAEHPMRIMVCLFLFYRILNSRMPFCVLGKLCRNIGMQGNVPVLRNEREGTESNGAGASPLQYFTAKKSISLTPRPWWRQCPRRFRRRWSAAHRQSPPGPWLPPASAPRRRQRSFPWGYPGRSCS